MNTYFLNKIMVPKPKKATATERTIANMCNNGKKIIYANFSNYAWFERTYYKIWWPCTRNENIKLNTHMI